MASGIPGGNCSDTGVCLGSAPSDQWQAGGHMVFCKKPTGRYSAQSRGSSIRSSSASNESFVYTGE
jgi:hypothetical protein